MIFRQLFDRVSGTYTYLIASRRGGEAFIIDPVLEQVDRYLQLLHELDLSLVMAIDTHLHADHITGLGALRDRTHCITVMGEQTQATWYRCASPTVIGSRSKARPPGHLHARPHRRFLLLLSDDRVFTGDTLLIRGTGRTDFQNGDARAQYDSLFKQLLKLPDDTLVYPGARLQGRHRQHHRRREGVQPAAAGQLGRRICRPHEQPQAAQPEDDGRGRARQYADRIRPGTRSRGAAGLLHRRRRWLFLVDRTWCSSTCASRVSVKNTASFLAHCMRLIPTCRTMCGQAGCYSNLPQRRANVRVLLRIRRALSNGGAGSPRCGPLFRLSHSRAGSARGEQRVGQSYYAKRFWCLREIRPHDAALEIQARRNRVPTQWRKAAALRSSVCLQTSPTCSSRGAGLKPRSSSSPSSTQYRLEATTGTSSAAGQRSRAAGVDDAAVAEPARYGSGR